MTSEFSDMQKNTKLQKGRLNIMKWMRKQKVASFTFPHESLGKSPKTTMLSKSAKDGNKASSILGTSKPKLGA